METALYITMIILSIALTIVVLLLAKGSSFSGGFGGDSSSIYHTRRGFERTLFQTAVILAVVWAVFAAITSIVA